jgi:Tfp pilus assembly protein PilW
MRRMLARLRRDEAGLSLSELLVASMLTVLVLSMVAGLFMQTARITSASSQTNNSSSIASNVANEITSVLRVATTNLRTGQTVADAAVVSGTRSTLTIYTLMSEKQNVDPAPVKVTFAANIDPTKGFTKTSCTGVYSGGFWTFTTCASTKTRDLGFGVQLPTSTSAQLFTYYDGAGNEIVIGDQPLSDTQRLQVAKIKVQVTALAYKSYNDPVQVINTVVLGNLGLETATS